MLRMQVELVRNVV